MDMHVTTIAAAIAATIAARMAKPAWRMITRPVGTLRAVETEHPHVVLTFDDGPDPHTTHAIASVLRRFNATATFFVLVPRVRNHVGMVKDLIAEGHEIGLHGLDHTRLTHLRSSEVLRRCRAGRAELEDLIGQKVRWFRAPYGALMPKHWAAVRAAGMMPVAWGPAAGDWQTMPEHELAETALASCTPGEIVLVHDSFAGPADGAHDGMPPAIDRAKFIHLLLSGLDERGLHARSIGDALRTGSPKRWAWFVR